MVWFYCDDCGDTPKLNGHYAQCSATSFTCIDCSRTFDRSSVHNHTTCVTEHEKYAQASSWGTRSCRRARQQWALPTACLALSLIIAPPTTTPPWSPSTQGVTKPGGFAEKGFYGDAKQQQPGKDASAEGVEFLSTRPPWKCSICNVQCTSQETLMGHAQGTKHKRRARAALAVKGGQAQGQQGAAQQPECARGSAAANGAAAPANGHVQQEQGPPGDEAKHAAEEKEAAQGDMGKKGKKRKAAEGEQAAAPAAAPHAQQEGEAGGAAHKAKKKKGDKGGTAEGAAPPPAAATAEQAPGAAAAAGKRPKWKKLAAVALREAGGSMKLKKLQAAVLAAVGGDAGDTAAGGAALLAVLRGSSKFEVAGKVVRLSAAAE
eukprot:scaffold2.g7445.t1